MSFFDEIFAVLDTRSFSSVWYWIALAVMWSTVSHFTLGVPQDLIARARRQGGTAREEAEILTHIQVRRRLTVMRSAGHWITAFVATVLALLMVLAVSYGVEIAQALLLLLLPLTLVGVLALRAAVRIEAFDERGAALWKRLARLRLATQVIGMISIFITALWGMWHVMTQSVLSG